MVVLSKYKQNFVPFYGWYESPEDVYLAMGYFPLGDLGRYMDRHLAILQIKAIIRQLLEGLCIMHRDGFTHRDLKPQNIFVVKDGLDVWVKIEDFGITKRVPQDGTSLKTEIFTSNMWRQKYWRIVTKKTPSIPMRLTYGHWDVFVTDFLPCNYLSKPLQQ